MRLFAITAFFTLAVFALQTRAATPSFYQAIAAWTETSHARFALSLGRNTVETVSVFALGALAHSRNANTARTIVARFAFALSNQAGTALAILALGALLNSRKALAALLVGGAQVAVALTGGTNIAVTLEAVTAQRTRAVDEAAGEKPRLGVHFDKI